MTNAFIILNATLNDDESHDELHNAIRDLIIMHRDDDIDDEIAQLAISPETARSLLTLIKSLDLNELTTIALTLSLCPIHLIDDEICADDESPDCAFLR
jgi:hypothetical protein